MGTRNETRRSAWRAALLLSAALAVTRCGNEEAPSGAPAAPLQASSPPYTVSAAGGVPATGPGDRYNACERVWCLKHGENFDLSHFLSGHVGWILHDDLHGDVFVPSGRTEGPAFPHAKREALRLCGSHVHPWLLGGGGGPVRHTGFNSALGYGRAHFSKYGTALDPCCVNGLGHGYVHARSGRRFPFHRTEDYRDHPEIGWQRPFQARR